MTLTMFTAPTQQLHVNQFVTMKSTGKHIVNMWICVYIVQSVVGFAARMTQPTSLTRRQNQMRIVHISQEVKADNRYGANSLRREESFGIHVH